MDTMHLGPVGDARVLDPATNRPLPQEGATVTRSQYWLRRIRSGEVQVVKKKRAERARREE